MQIQSHLTDSTKHVRRSLIHDFALLRILRYEKVEMCDIHGSIILGLAEELGYECEISYTNYWWITPDNLWFSVQIIDDRLRIEPGGRQRWLPIITLELSHPQLIEQLKKVLQDSEDRLSR